MPSPSGSPTPLARLRTLELLPECVSNRGHALSVFKKIDAIRVTFDREASGDAKFRVDVFTGGRRSRIPTLHRLASTGGDDASPSNLERPTASTHKTCHDFSDLRSRLYRVIHEAHETAYCDVCEQLLEYSLWGNTQPNALARVFVDDDKIAQSLARFLEELVPLTAACAPTDGRRLCNAQAQVPSIVHEFLFGSG